MTAKTRRKTNNPGHEPVNLRKEARHLPGYIICILWTAFTFILVGWVFAASFSTSAEIFSPNMFKYETGFHFENYVKAWSTQNVSVFFLNSLVYSLISLFFIVLVAAPASYAVSRFKFRGNTLLQNGFATAMGVPVIMIIMPIFSLATRLDLVNTRGLITFLYIATNVPFTVFFLMAFFRNLPTDFEEAAAIDGSSPIATFWRIMFPLAQPGIITVVIFDFIVIWNEYFMSMLFANKTAIRPVAVGLFNMVQAMRYTGDWGGMFAAVVIVTLPTFILYLFLSNKIIEGVTGGAIKG